MNLVSFYRMTMDPIKPKNAFEENLEKLDLQGCLLLMVVLSERALYLQSKDLMDKKTLVKPALIK